jgi:hypothetical protein
MSQLLFLSTIITVAHGDERDMGELESVEVTD